jgi:protein-tyrosine phosphatase
MKSPSIPRERTRDELIDSIVHTRTREHRAMPGFKSATDFDERRSLRVDCDKVFNGIIIGNGETICNITYLKNIGVSHVLNTATEHVVVNPEKYPAYDIKYHGFHVDDLPEANISRYFHTTTKFIDQAVSSGGLVVVNCVMGWSRSATCVAAYLMMKHGMSATKALELIRQNRSIRPNAGFLQQLADLENTLSKRVVW